MIQSSKSPQMKKSKDYNLDNLEMYDDPNFNPFETKTKVGEDFVKSECLTELVQVENYCVESKMSNTVDDLVKTEFEEIIDDEDVSHDPVKTEYEEIIVDKEVGQHNATRKIPTNENPDPVKIEMLHCEIDDATRLTSTSPRLDDPNDLHEPLVDNLDIPEKIRALSTVNTE